MKNDESNKKPSLPWEAINAKVEEHTEDGDNPDGIYVLDSLTIADYEGMCYEELSLIAAMRTVGASSDRILEAEGKRIYERALDKVRSDCFPDGDISELKIEMNGHLFTAQLKELMIGYASGEVPIPAPAFADIGIDMCMKRTLN